MRYVVVTTFIFLISFSIASAQVVISEVMYNLEGPDDKHEWVEVFNSSANEIDLTDWRFNDGSNHILYVPPEKEGQGSIIIQSGETAILADNAAIFLTDHPSFSGTVINTAMNLNNTQDTLLIKDVEGITIDTVTYTSEQGAYEDGNSLQLISGSWSAGAPTPGSASVAVEESEEPEPEESPEAQISSPSSAPVNNFPTEQQIFANAGTDRNVIVGADSLFEGESLGLQKKPLEGARYIWNFGNGETKEGQNVLHYYQYPGEYIVMLNVSSGQYSASDRIVVNAYSAELVLSKVENDFVEIHNKSNQELNLSWWQLESQGERFMIPKDTIVLANKKLFSSKNITGLDTSVKEGVSLLYPNGVEAVLFTQMHIPQKTIAVKKTVAGKGLSSRNEVERGETLRSEKEETIIEENVSVKTAQAASVSSFKSDGNKNSIYKWLLAIFAVVGISAGIMVYASGKKELGDDIEIIE